MIKKLFTVFLIIILTFSLVACEKPQEVVETNENPPKRADIYKETIKSYLIIPNNYVAPKYNGKLVAGERPDKMNEPQPRVYETNGEEGFYDENGERRSRYNEVYRLKPSEDLKSKMEEYNGQDVWFRVLADIWVSYGLIGELSQEKVDKYYAFTKNETLEFLNQIGAHDIKTEFHSSEGANTHSFEASMTAEMIDMLSNKCYKLMLGQYPRNPLYNSKISDSVSIRLDKMSDSKTAEIVAVCVADKYSNYATNQKLPANFSYNSELFKPFAELTNVTLEEYNNKIDKYLADIYGRNNIAEKIIVSDKLPKVKYARKADMLRKETLRDDYLREVSIGFNAELTKAEILKLAEDDEIKVIYLAPVKEAVWPH